MREKCVLYNAVWKLFSLAKLFQMNNHNRIQKIPNFIILFFKSVKEKLISRNTLVF